MKRYNELIKPLDQKAMEIAKKYQSTLVKPPESLGTLEDISVQIAGITGRVRNKTDKKIHFVLGADNGIYEETIASAPQNFTNMLLSYYAAGQNCGINVLCNAVNVDLKAVDIGVIGKIESPNIIDHKLMTLFTSCQVPVSPYIMQPELYYQVIYPFSAKWCKPLYNSFMYILVIGIQLYYI
jgi:nicotinate-nucleotide--dimethylbenzimidazole phosphoribosyltransferase